MLKRRMLLVFLALLTGCPSDDGQPARPADMGIQQDQSPDQQLTCGAHTIVRGGCAARCPAPCQCVTVFDDKLSANFVPLELCATPCSSPGSCPGSERCSVVSYYYNKYQSPVCLPWTLQSPTSTGMTVHADCHPYTPGFINPMCRGNHLVQRQPFMCKGTLTGSICAEVLLETCSGGCKTGDAGPSCTAPDAGASTPDAGGTCCLSNYFGSCRFLGGAKKAPHGCRFSCCSPCTWNKGKDSHGCPTWTPTVQDAGTGG